MAEKIPFGSVGREIDLFSFDRDPETHEVAISVSTNKENYPRLLKAGHVIVEIDDEVRVFNSMDEYIHYEKWAAGSDLEEIDLIIATQKMPPFKL